VKDPFIAITVKIHPVFIDHPVQVRGTDAGKIQQSNQVLSTQEKITFVIISPLALVI
jgi:hypothetical protein